MPSALETLNSTGANSADRSLRIVFLDWLRIAAFLCVLACHQFLAPLLQLAASPDTGASQRQFVLLILPFFELAGAGVVMFFLVSGYIITHVLMRESGLAFLVRRFFRIYPLYVAAVLIQTAGQVWIKGEAVNVPDLLLRLSLCGDPFHLAYGLGGVEWTLRIEVLFYAFMAALKFAGFVDGPRARWLPFVLASMALALLVMPPTPGTWTPYFAYYNLFAPFLLLGAFFHLHENGRVGALALAAMSVMVLAGVWTIAPIWQPHLVGDLFVPCGFGCFFLLWLLRKHLRLPVAAAVLSELTYAIYLFHNWMYDHLLRLSRAGFRNEWVANLVALCALFVGCWVAIRCVERPAVRLGRHLSRRFQPRIEISATAEAPLPTEEGPEIFRQERFNQSSRESHPHSKP